jgi:hypothetical protein
MTIAIMQPYLFPYLGYYQLVSAVDKFVVFDDVNYINKGWINRNRILQHKEVYKFSIPLKKASQNKLINEIDILDYANWRTDFIKLLEFNYKKAPHFTFVMDWVTEFLNSRIYNKLGDLAADSVIKLSALFQLKTEFIFSSNLSYRGENITGGNEKVLKICELLHTSKYINLQNGMAIYDEGDFNRRKIDLKFIVMDKIVYPQFEKGRFEESLSILDVMMFNTVDEIKRLLGEFTLINKKIEI